MIFVYLFGGSLVDNIENPTKPTLNLPENVTAVEWYASLWSEYKLAPPVSDRSFEIYRYISGVECGFWISWLDMFGYSGNLALKPKALPLPKINKPFSVATLDGYFIPQNTAHPKEAWQWITYLLQKPQVAGGQIPPLESQIDTSQFTNQISPDVLEIARTLSSNTHFIGIQYIENSTINQLGTLFSEAVNQVVIGETDAQSALDAAQREAEKLFLETK
jgi:ABC-type glycerol-3-phosphate transport system substrate-binding protein